MRGACGLVGRRVVCFGGKPAAFHFSSAFDGGLSGRCDAGGSLAGKLPLEVSSTPLDAAPTAAVATEEPGNDARAGDDETGFADEGAVFAGDEFDFTDDGSGLAAAASGAGAPEEASCRSAARQSSSAVPSGQPFASQIL